MRDGTFAPNAWRRGDRVLSLGAPRSGIGYQITITYQPDRTYDN